MSEELKYPAFLLYPQDFLSDPNVAAMDTEQIGAYFLLLCYCWIGRGELTTDSEELRSLARCSKHMWKRKSAKIFSSFYLKAPKFLTGLEQVYSHKRLDKERRKLMDKSKLGRRAAKKRWEGEPNSSDADALPTQCLSSSIALTRASKSTIIGKKIRTEPEAFSIQSLIEEKLISYGARKDHEHSGFYHKVCQYLPEPIINAAIMRANDKTMEQRAGGDKIDDLHRYFIGTLRDICKQEGIQSPIKWNGVR